MWALEGLHALTLDDILRVYQKGGNISVNNNALAAIPSVLNKSNVKFITEFLAGNRQPSLNMRR